MTRDEAPAPDGGTASKTGSLPFDTSVANHARVYDYLLGGKDNYAVDRAAVDAVLEIYPDLAFTARANRAFLGRAVRYLAGEAGIRQFLDIGTGIPTAGSTHEVAQGVAPEARVVYVDYDPTVLAHARALLTSDERGTTEYIEADLRDTGTILSQARQLLDFGKPTAIMLIAILHAIPDSDDLHAIVARLLDAVPPGSYLAVSHMGLEFLRPGMRQDIVGIASRMSHQQYTYRSREQLMRFFQGTDLVEPGLVQVEEWRPEPEKGETAKSSLWCAVGRKR